MINFAIIALLVAVDQIVKRWAYVALQPIRHITVIDGVLGWTYLENRGVAFGFFYGGRWFFIIATLILFGMIYFHYKKLPTEGPYKILRFSLVLIVAGGIGNFIDRLFLGFVIDYIHLLFMNFPVFNIADILVSVGAGLYFFTSLFAIKEQ